jgi:hypothetical protein
LDLGKEDILIDQTQEGGTEAGEEKREKGYTVGENQ